MGWRQLSLRQKIGQTVVLSSDLEAETRAGGGSLRAFFEKYPAGGVFLGAWKLEHLDPQDFRDQHLVTTVNSLSLPEWRRTCGRVFQGLIEAGVASVMVGPHPSGLPEGTTRRPPAAGHPSREIVTDLLKGELGFEGVVISNAPREKVISISYGDPYVHDVLLPRVGTAINAYGDCPAVQRAVVRALAGEIGMPGKSPVDLDALRKQLNP